jgi:Plasmid pRiA4b ORF-3-like protein
MMPQDLIVTIKLVGVKPRISRRVQVSINLGLHRFHQLIQVVMGWEDTVPHLWHGWGEDFGDPRQFVPPGPLDERKASAAALFATVGDVATYVYDLDAEWIHELVLTDMVPAEPVPILIEGIGACPPEGIEGAYAYEQFKLALKDRSHPFWKVDGAFMRSFQGFNPKHFPQQQTAARLECLIASWRNRPRRKPAFKSHSLMLIDNEPIRRRYRKELDRARTQLHKLEAELERFKGDDDTAFKVWLYRTFPVRLSRIRELHEKVAKLASRLNLMREFQNHGVKTPGAAYHRAVRVETGEDPMPDFPPPPVSHLNPESIEERELLRAAMRGLAEDMGLDSDSIEDELDTMLGEPEEDRQRPKKEGYQECQSLYRQIALRLHPDRGGTMSEAEAQIWYRAQDAYAAHDVLTLRQLWSRIADQSNSLFQLSCGDMIAAIIETETQIAALRALRDSLKREPAWNFSRLTAKQLQSRRIRVEKDLVEQEASIREQLEELRRQCEHFSELRQRWEAKNRGPVAQMNLF